MKGRYYLFFGVFGVAVIAFGWGLSYLVRLRLDRGDVYPPYSSFRSDPMGSKVLYEALRKTGYVEASRNTQSLLKIHSLESCTLLYFSEGEFSFRQSDPEVLKHLDFLLGRGGRIVLTFRPTGEISESEKISPASSRTSESEKEVEKSDPLKKSPPPSALRSGGRRTSIMDRWGVHLKHEIPKGRGEKKFLEPFEVEKSGDQPGPEKLSWNSTLYFANLDPAWKVYYEWEGHPVLVERPYLKGSIVLASDSYFISNEALRFERHTDLLLLLLGSSKKVIFEEVHFGFRQDPSLVMLAHRYGFEGVFWGLLVLAVLFIWKNSSSLVPAPAEEQRLQKALTVKVQSSDDESLTSLLRRNLRVSMLPEVCYQEWKKNQGRRWVLTSEDEERIRSFLDASSEPVHKYNQLTQFLIERTRYGIPKH